MELLIALLAAAALIVLVCRARNTFSMTGKNAWLFEICADLDRAKQLNRKSHAQREKLRERLTEAQFEIESHKIKGGDFDGSRFGDQQIECYFVLDDVTKHGELKGNTVGRKKVSPARQGGPPGGLCETAEG